MVRHLYYIRGQRISGVEDGCFAFFLHVAGHQDCSFAKLQTQNDRVVVAEEARIVCQ